MGQWISFDFFLPLLVSKGPMTATESDFIGSLMNVPAPNVPVMRKSVSSHTFCKQKAGKASCDTRLCFKNHKFITRGRLVHSACGNSK